MDKSTSSPKNTSRRSFLNKAATAGLAGSGLAAAISGCTKENVSAGAGSDVGAAPTAANTQKSNSNIANGVNTSNIAKYSVAPGQLDEYYMFSSAGHAGDVRIFGLPSGREFKRVPVFNTDCMVGWGITNESKAIIGTNPDGTPKYNTGDTHHIHPSYTDGTYDGRYLFVNDKINCRLGRVRLDTMECDKITEIPNIQGFHGTFPDKCDPIKPEINYTTRVFCGSEFSVPLPNLGHGLDDTDNYRSLFSCVDAETMEVRWQVLIDGNCELVASSYDGKLAATTQYNTEMGVHYEDMMSSEMDTCLFFNVARIEEAIKDGKFTTYGDSKVPVVDGRIASNTDPKTALTCYVPIPKNPHGVNISPDGKYYACSGKLSPTASVIAHEKVLQWFEGEFEDARQAVVAEPELGLGPLHTAFDGRGNAYTTLFLDSQIVKWNVENAIKFYQGDHSVQVVLDRLDVHYQPGHGFTSMGETREADGKYLISDNKFSKDRFLPVGPLHPETSQLIDISGDKMQLVHDNPVSSEPHDSIIIRRDIIKPKQVYSMDQFPLAVRKANESGIERSGKKVIIKIASQAPMFSLREFRVKQNDEVTIILTNLDRIEDLTHGFAIERHNINFVVNPQETKSVTFVAKKPGVYWCYCTHFCHALHMEMRSRFIVEPA